MHIFDTPTLKNNFGAQHYRNLPASARPIIKELKKQTQMDMSIANTRPQRKGDG